jgi:hypothetical protein
MASEAMVAGSGTGLKHCSIRLISADPMIAFPPFVPNPESEKNMSLLTEPFDVSAENGMFTVAVKFCVTGEFCPAVANFEVTIHPDPTIVAAADVSNTCSEAKMSSFVFHWGEATVTEP